MRAGGDAQAGSPAHDLARGFAAHVVRWAQASGAPGGVLPIVREIAARLSLAVAEGHVCLPLGELAEPCRPPGQLRACLLESGVVARAPQGADGAAPAAALILDGSDRLYLRRHFEYERRLARALLQRVGGVACAPAKAHVAARLHGLFEAPVAGAPNWQKLAVALALERRLTLISGGPGTGKTTAVAALLGCLIEAQPDLRIVLAAPTGKAAARMLEALRARAANLPEEIRVRLPGEAWTLHRLLGVTSQAGRFRHHAGNPLALDVLVVDEASMLDLALAARLADALPDQARLVLLGDKDQLAAVEAGAVFAALSADPSLAPGDVESLARLAAIPPECIRPQPPRQPTPLAGCVVWLSKSYRFAADSGIGRLAADVCNGRGDALVKWLAEDADASVKWLDDGAHSPAAAVWAHIEQGYAAYATAMREYAGDPAPVFAAFECFRVLCAVHEGQRGLAAVNERLTRTLRPLCVPARACDLAEGSADAPQAGWYPGRPVIVLRNDHAQRLFNGDTGICLPGPDGALQVVFRDGLGGWRALAPARVPEHHSAYAMTVHKSQGSEFGKVLVLLPAAAVRVVSRELLYTAVTRAVDSVVLAASAAVLVAACAAPSARNSGLIDRMWEA